VNRQCGRWKPIGFDWLHIGLSQIYLGDWSAARESLDAATRQFVELGDERAQIPVLIAWSRLERRLGEASSARGHADRALALARETSYRRAIVLANEELADLAFESGNTREAITILEAALRDAEEIASEGDLVYEIAWRLALALAQTDPERADELAGRSLRLAHASGDRREAGSARVALALVRSRRGRGEDAVRHLQAGLREFEAIETPFELAGAHEAAAEVLERLGDRATDVVAHLLEARRLYSRLGAAHAVARLEDGVAVRTRALHPAKTPSRVPPGPGDALAEDPRMKALFQTARDLAPYDSTVLIEGETGSGKEVVARLLHDAGPRRPRPFVALNCAAFPATLLESELFGHRRGAFTGADRDYRGRLAAAEDGTVLLDEIDKASPDFQAKLLRVIEDRRVHPVGSTEFVPLRARIVCATNRDLRALADRGAFLADLYFRLAAFRLQIPPLRERPDDIHAFVRHYLDACAGRFGADHYDVSREAMRALVAYHWPGNVRELKNVLESAAFFARVGGVIEPTHLPPEIADALGHPGRVSLPARIEQLERNQIELALKKSKGNKADAARMLGVSRKGLLDRLRRLGFD
jgi:DNA-binding NtrC family response regulator